MVKYIAIYVRVSTGQQVTKGTSLEGQIENCYRKAKTLAEQLGYHEDQIKIYKETGVSGEDIDIRPEMTRLREDIQDELVSHVIVQHPDRLSRDMTDKLVACREFEKNNVELAFTDTEFEKSPEGILFFNIMSSIASYELALIKKRTVRGRLKAVQQDQKVMPMRVPPFGYELENGKLIINEEEAQYVRKVYHWYVYDGLTLRQIGEKLYQEGVSPKRKESDNWHASSIGRMLKNEIYIGKYVYNRRESQKVRGELTKAGNAKKKYSIRDEEDWITIPVSSIIDETLFDMAQAQKQKNYTKGGNIKYDYLLKGLIICECGRKWQATAYSGRVDKETGERKKYLAYRCPNRVPKKYGPEVKKCETPSIRAEQLEEYIWNLIVETLSNPDDYRINLENTANELSDSYKAQAERIQNQIHQKEKKKEKLKFLFLDELISQEEMKKDMTKINNEINALQKDMESYENKLYIHDQQKITNEKMESLIQSAQSFLKGKGKDGLTHDEKRNIIERLIDEIHITCKENGEIEIRTVGALDDLIHDIDSRTQRQEV